VVVIASNESPGCTVVHKRTAEGPLEGTIRLPMAVEVLN
jgi:hypothetical protein